MRFGYSATKLDFIVRKKVKKPSLLGHQENKIPLGAVNLAFQH